MGSEPKVLVHKTDEGLAIQGFDPVAFFTHARAGEGDPILNAVHEDAVYRFASATNRDLFVASPAKYTPAYGGYCASAVTKMAIKSSYPTIFWMHEGRLFFFHSDAAYEEWAAALEDNVAQADDNWPKLVEKFGTSSAPAPVRWLTNKTDKAVAIQGYDPVAYVTEKKAVQGTEEYSAVHEDAVYHFASQENRNLFAADPKKYLPAFGGFCGYMASLNTLKDITPTCFDVTVLGRTVLMHNPKALELWKAKKAENMAKATGNWEGLVFRFGSAPTTKTLLNKTEADLALQGYDAVAYFTQHTAVHGSPEFSAMHQGLTYRFASAVHLELFTATPSKYAPAFGGYCAYAASRNALKEVTPFCFDVAEGRLFLFSNEQATALWKADEKGCLARAEEEWPGLVVLHGLAPNPKILVNKGVGRLALQGHDPVAYFTQKKAVSGKPLCTAVHEDAVYRFFSFENRDKFMAEPAKYVPVYGGYCAYGASRSVLKPITPTLFEVVDDKLYFLQNKEAMDHWKLDWRRIRYKANANWPGMVSRHGEPVQTKVLVNKMEGVLAIQGYDPVAYFTFKRAEEGDPSYTATFEDAIYQFATAAHRDQFLRYPQKYVPAFGGYCTYAASLNVLKDITPSCFDILDGRLVLFHNESALEIWHEDAERTFAKSKANWAGLVVQHGTHAGSRVLVNQEDGPVAIQGYDPVAYIEQKEAVQGNAQFSSVFGGMIYRFASPANQATFQESPAKYMPSYGGYCGYGVSLNVLKDITPTCFDVVDGRLVLVHNQKALELWKHSPSRTLHRADANWPGLVMRKGTVPEEKVLVNKNEYNLALQGYDPVAYFTQKAAVRGLPDFTAVQDDAIYRFASAENQHMFLECPKMYAPAFGGYCGYAASMGVLQQVSPQCFDVFDGRLVLQHNDTAQVMWRSDARGAMMRAQANWPSLEVLNGSVPVHKVLVNKSDTNLALQGYDPVAYFTQSMAVEGHPSFTAVYENAIYRFNCAEHRDRFTQNPSKYVPAFGGYCGYSAARNVLKPVTASVGSIIGGRLILMHDEKTYDIWKQDIKGVLAKADANWPALLSRHGAPLEPYVLVNKNESGIALQGYDPVAYYTLKRATPGDPQYTTAFEDAIYQFVSAEHRDTFIKNPHRYAPMFGGYCGTALSMNMLVEITPSCFEIVDGHLVLFHTKESMEAWNNDPDDAWVKAEANWPALAVRHGGTPGTKILVNADAGLAIRGYDPVAYFRQGEATKGCAHFVSVQGGVIYQFACAENLAAFVQCPKKYTPAFGGHCGYAASSNELKDIDPTCFDIVAGRLVLLHNKEALSSWKRSPGRLIARADVNWPGLMARSGSSPVPKVLINKTEENLALQGYDAVAYFKQNEAVVGHPQYTAVHEDVIYRFASEENRNLFADAPTTYAPAFGGYCAYGASLYALKEANPFCFDVIGGRLCVFSSEAALVQWKQDDSGAYKRAEQNWPGLVLVHGRIPVTKVVVNKNDDGVALNGYDPVAFFRKNRPIEGKADCRVLHEGAIYYFASPVYRRLFLECPSKYLPAFGGYCAYAASQGALKPVQSSLFDIIKGQLLFFGSFKAFAAWQHNTPLTSAAAEAQWPGLVERYGHTLETPLLVNKNDEGVALKGYDAVAFFTQTKAVPGSPAFAAVHNDAIYHFASARTRDVFAKAPSKYVPAFGGYCAYALASNALKDVKPEVFAVADARLMLFSSKKAFKEWVQEGKGNLSKADKNWPYLQVRDGKFPDAKVLVNKPSDLPVALQGYDPVSYFTRNKAIEGSKRFGAVHEDAVYLFSTPDNRDMFAKAPHKYVPAFGGFCGLAVTHNKLKDVKPDCFDVVKDRLVLLSGKEALSMWLKDRQGLLAEADANWPRLVVTNGAPLDTPSVLVNKDAEDLALEGFDPVVYFRKFYFGRISLPQEGLAEITGVHNDSIYRMASPEHQQLFMLCPSRYVPAFGGYCAVKVAQGVLEVADPTIYDIVEGRVVVFSTFADFTQWQRDPELYAKAKASWPSLVLCYGTHPSNVTPLINADESGVALHGYDPVAYFTQHKAVVGGDEGSRYHDATYWFATAEHQEQFQKAPKKFSPAFGGYCAYGVSRGVLKDITPTLFDARGGRLVLLQNKEALDAYKRDPAGVLAKADANWIKLQESGGRSQPAPTRASA